jgi:hypothetical protein
LIEENKDILKKICKKITYNYRSSKRDHPFIELLKNEYKYVNLDWRCDEFPYQYEELTTKDSLGYVIKKSGDILSNIIITGKNLTKVSIKRQGDNIELYKKYLLNSIYCNICVENILFKKISRNIFVLINMFNAI